MMQLDRQDCNIPAIWLGSSTAALMSAFEQQGYSRLDAVSAACAQKYGISEYFAIHRQEREKANWSTTFLEICRELAVDEQSKITLAVGVNDGMDIEHFRHCQVVGIDPCREALRLAQASFPQYQFHLAIAEALPLANASVDSYMALRVVNCSCVDLATMIAELDRVLKPDGYFIFSVATGFYQGEQFIRGALKHGRVDPEGATLVTEKLVDKLYSVGMHLKLIENNPTETFVVGQKLIKTTPFHK
jgi:SAM-dependent methyltransferase